VPATSALRAGVQWQLQQAHMARVVAAATGPLSLPQLRAAAAAAPRLTLFQPASDATAPPAAPLALPAPGDADGASTALALALAPAHNAHNGASASASAALVAAPPPLVATPVDVSAVDWGAIAALKLPRRSGAECAAQWANFEDPELNTVRFRP
jgi:hypothetical protein